MARRDAIQLSAIIGGGDTLAKYGYSSFGSLPLTVPRGANVLIVDDQVRDKASGPIRRCGRAFVKYFLDRGG